MVNFVGMAFVISSLTLIATLLIANRGTRTGEMSAAIVAVVRVLAAIVLFSLIFWLMMFRSKP
jgi:hypothetical protein